MSDVVQSLYGKRQRTRVCGICTRQDQILLVNHIGLRQGDFWAPPGGGIQLMEPAEHALAREIREETNLEVEVNEFLFACEYIKAPLHAIELFFRVSTKAGTLQKGSDPEMKPDEQLIKSVRWIPWVELEKMPVDQLHGAFKKVAKPVQILGLRGYFKL
ncbi:MAG: NUDIX domain-containing protein [Cyclobacteriaceae bacterium]